MNLIIHPDELFLKGANQRLFYDQLINNLKQIFKQIKVERTESGLWVENFEENKLSQLAKVPGISNFAVGERGGNGVEEIKKNVLNLLKQMSRDDKDAVTFRVTTTRSYKGYPLSSKQLDIEIGDFVRQKYGWQVNLKNYDLNISVNIGKENATVYSNPIEGAGGLPTGVSGKMLCLLSGGIDSPVAAYKMMTRGAEVGLIHFQNQTSVTDEVSEKIFDLAKILSLYQSKIKIFIIPFADLQKQVVMSIPAEYRMLVTRRLFFKIAENIAKNNNYQALITGDSLGQVASQTVENLTVTSQAVEMLKFSPLIGANKKDIMEMAKQIGTYEISTRPYEDCCSLFVAKHPQTRAKINDVLKLEKNLSLPDLDKTTFKSYYISNN